MISLRQLQVFKTIADTSGLTAASKRLNMTTSAVSINLKDIEQQLGTRLVVRERGRKRSSQKVELTAAGLWLYERADRILSISDGTKRYFEQMHNNSRETLNIGASQTVGNYWLPAYINALKQQRSTLKINVHISNTDEILNRVESFQDDIGLVEGPNSRSDILAKPFKEDSMTLITPPDDEGRTLELQPWLIRETGSATRRLTENLWAKLAIKPANVTELNTNESIIHSVASGIGVAYVPSITTPLMLEAGLVKSLSTKGAHHRTLYYVTHSDLSSRMAWIEPIIGITN